MSGLYSAFRSNGAPTFYAPLQTAVQADILEAGLIFCFLILALSFYCVLPGIPGKEMISTFIRITVSLFIGAVILLSNFAMTWEVAEVNTRTKYKAGTGSEIEANVAVYIGLRGINVTLKGEPENQLNETINYNEHFSWEWRQGRLGFGPFAGRFQQEYRAAQFRGLPLPILWVAEYFTFDGEGIRWGRFYRQAGWYSHIMLWLAFPLWLLANILFFVLLRYGAYFLCMTGSSMVISCIIWATLRNVNELAIPFTDADILEFSYGGSFYVCLITGIVCIILAAVVFIMDLRQPQMIASFFSVDTIQDSEELQVEQEEPVVPSTQNDDDTDDEQAAENGTNGADGHPTSTEAESPDDIYDVRLSMGQELRPSSGLTQRFTKRFQKPRRRPPPPPPVRPNEPEEAPEEDYINLQDELYQNDAGISTEELWGSGQQATTHH